MVLDALSFVALGAACLLLLRARRVQREAELDLMCAEASLGAAVVLLEIAESYYLSARKVKG